MRRRGSRKRRRRRLVVLLAAAAAVAAGAWGWTALRDLWRTDRVASLQKERDELRARLAALRAKDPVVGTAPDAEVLVGVPAGAAADLLARITARLVHQVDVVLRDVDVHRAGEVHTKGLVKTPGSYRVDLRVHEVNGVLEPGPPKLDIQGDKVGVSLPVRLARGEGRGTLRLAWDSHGIAGLACGDFNARIPVAGRLVPRTYPVRGSFALALEEGVLVATPSFPDVELNLQVEPSAATWKEVGRVLSERSAPCRAALKKVDVPALLRRLLDRGFDVKVPPEAFRPLRLPVGLRREVAVGGKPHVVLTAPREVALAPGVVWLGADVVGDPRPEGSPGPE